jgi:transglutaminase-like putative cysteine protease
MNRYRITHQTTYTYSGLVQLGSHALRLRPREGYDLRIESSILTIQPPAFLRWHRDVEGNSVAIADFNALSDQLLVESVLLIEKYDQQPLDFLVEEYAVNYPFAYAPEDCAILQPYRWDGLHESGHLFPDLLSTARGAGGANTSSDIDQTIGILPRSSIPVYGTG